MCFNDNSAKLSARYVSAQLAATWKNATECVNFDLPSNVVDMRSHHYDKHKFTRALAQWHYAGRRVPHGQIAKETLYFDGTFAEPRLEFICNHEVALFLKLDGGHYNSVYPSRSNVSGYKANQKENLPLTGVEVAFRLNFSRRIIEGTDTKIGNGPGHRIQMIILDFASAKMVGLGSKDLEFAKEPLAFYMRKYLEFLHLAGNHVIFDLPDFESDTYRHSINYSLVSTAFEQPGLCTDIEIYGTSVKAINQYLTTAWLDVAARRFSLHPPSDPLAGCIYEVRSDWLPTPERHFHLAFAPPVIRPLCKTEVVLYLTASVVGFYDGPDFSIKPIQTFAPWTFAFVLDVVQDKTNEVTLLKLNMGSARYCERLSTLAISKEHRATFFEVVRKFISEEYLALLVSYNFHVIFSPHAIFDDGPEFSGISEDEAEWKVVSDTSGMKQNEVIMWGETVRKITMHGVDHIVAISEESINTLFRSLRGKFVEDCLYRWTYEHFTAEFGHIKIKLLSNGHALVIFTIESGTMKLKNGSEEHTFEAWNIAYEVPIKMVDAHELHWHKFVGERFRQSSVCGRYTTIRHVILDFAHAEYIGKQSLMPGMWGTPRSDALDDASDVINLFREGESHSEIVKRSSNAVSRLETILHYMNHYLKEVAQAGHNIIHSVPIVSTPIVVEDDIGVTSATFQIISKDITTISNCVYKHSAPVLLVLGMTHGREFPKNLNIPWGNGWVFPRAHGTLCLPSDIFLNGRLLPRLSVINAKTTIVPRFPEENEEEWQVYLTTWENHRYRSKTPCNWKFLSGTADWLEYGWEHRDEWTYEHEGTRHATSGFSVLCHTKNQLVLPTTYRAGVMEIKLQGESVLRVKDVQQERSKKTAAKWAAIIRIITTPIGLSVTLVSRACPVFERTESTGAWTIDTEDMLRRYLPNVIDIDAVLAELKLSLEGSWKWSSAGLATYDLASPVFNKHGDLIVQLRQNVHILPIPTIPHHGPDVITIPKGADLVPNGHFTGLAAPEIERSISGSSEVTVVESVLPTKVTDETNFLVEVVNKAPEPIEPLKARIGVTVDAVQNGNAIGNGNADGPLVVS